MQLCGVLSECKESKFSVFIGSRETFHHSYVMFGFSNHPILVDFMPVCVRVLLAKDFFSDFRTSCVLSGLDFFLCLYV